MARYVLLRIEDDDQAADLITDMAVYPDGDILTPSQEHHVHATVVDLENVDREGHWAHSYRVGDEIVDAIHQSHCEFLTNPAAYAEEG